MGYGEKELYNAQNVIGYTGKLGANPTFYFKKDLGGGQILYGHITQSHMLTSNIGREKIEKIDSKKYEIKNDGVLYRTNQDEGEFLAENYKNKAAILNGCKETGETNEKVTIGDPRTNKTYIDKNNEKWTLVQSSVEIVNGELKHPSRTLIKFVNAKNLDKKVSSELQIALDNPKCQLMKDQEQINIENHQKKHGYKEVEMKIHNEIFEENFENMLNGNLSGSEQDEDIAALDALVAEHTHKKTPEESLSPSLNQKKDNKSTPDKQVNENVLNALSSGNVKKLAQKHDPSKDPKLEKPLVQNQKFGLEDLASPGFRKNKRAKQNTRSTNSNRSGNNKTRQRRNSSKGPSKQF
ncbi:hypothetical protein [Aquimarina spongiae]|uniref:Uncharacterized protein n=1 Tax=Aquimarina spongiae TaxID=570521 RepID=A0A1M6J342_9FLAO|nr:hypothetical protein [Aquimarina spongiae]SHJ41150.1 hypothetical protein SAMN04488508_108220 [Aquimarina spongiae]